MRDADDYVDILFDGPPSQEGRFIDIEDPEGKSTVVGKWIQDVDVWRLRIYRQDRQVSKLKKMAKRLNRQVREWQVKATEDKRQSVERLGRINQLGADILNQKEESWKCVKAKDRSIAHLERDLNERQGDVQTLTVLRKKVEDLRALLRRAHPRLLCWRSLRREIFTAISELEES